MTTYRERLTAPLSWYIAALAFALVWGWVFIVATTWVFAIIVTVVLTAAGFGAVWRYGSLLVVVGADGLHVGRAFVETTHISGATSLDRASYRTQLGTGADVRAYLATRPYLDHGVVVTIDDPADPTPYWLVSSRHPDALAASLDPNHPKNPNQTIGDTPRGEEA
ncbi:MAG: DUF3093 domain-containing protein [Aeromicrobium sp.]